MFLRTPDLWLECLETIDGPLDDRRAHLLKLLREEGNENEKVMAVEYEVIEGNISELERFFEYAVEGDGELVTKGPAL